MNKKCLVEGCDNKYCAKGYCSKHYQVWKRNGIPETELTLKRGRGFIDGCGYKKIPVNGKSIREHRYIMEQHLGRKLENHEHVHHINHNKIDNRIENLKLVSNEEHISLEHKRIFNSEDVKECTKCKLIKEINEFSYRKYKSKNNGEITYQYDSWCKKCGVDAKRDRRHYKQSNGLKYT